MLFVNYSKILSLCVCFSLIQLACHFYFEISLAFQERPSIKDEVLVLSGSNHEIPGFQVVQQSSPFIRPDCKKRHKNYKFLPLSGEKIYKFNLKVMTRPFRRENVLTLMKIIRMENDLKLAQN